MDALLQQISHRPWPVPAGHWVMQQSWHDLLFAHWPVSASDLRALIPPSLALDTFSGECWVGVVPFRMSGIRRRGLPAIAGLSRFPELNVRTYVTYRDKPGVFFFSLDAANFAAVFGARALYHLPYFYARMKVEEIKGSVRYLSHRYGRQADFSGSYRPSQEIDPAAKGSIAHWLTERYCLYTAHRGVLYRGDIHHRPWPLQAAEAELKVNTVALAAGITLPKTRPLLHFARKLDVLIWPVQRADLPPARV